MGIVPPGGTQNVIKLGVSTDIPVTGGPGGDFWGDYSRARGFRPSGNAWVVVGHTSTGVNGNAVPRYVVFGRNGDLPSFQRWDQT